MYDFFFSFSNSNMKRKKKKKHAINKTSTGDDHHHPRPTPQKKKKKISLDAFPVYRYILNGEDSPYSFFLDSIHRGEGKQKDIFSPHSSGRCVKGKKRKKKKSISV